MGGVCLAQRTKTVVTPQWVEDSLLHGRLMAIVDYIPIDELKQSSGNSRGGIVHNTFERSNAIPQRAMADSHPTSSQAARNHEEEGQGSDASYIPRYTSSYACQRHSPLVCPNQELIGELLVIKRAREVDGDMRSMLSYARAISVSIFDRNPDWSSHYG
jgi:DNA polymerase IV